MGGAGPAARPASGPVADGPRRAALARRGRRAGRHGLGRVGGAVHGLVAPDGAGVVAAAVARDKPIFGVCFGAQLLAVVCGGQVQRATAPERGWLPVASREPDLVPTGPWLSWHDDVFSVPSGGAAWPIPTAATPLLTAALRHSRLVPTWACSSIRRSTRPPWPSGATKPGGRGGCRRERSPGSRWIRRPTPRVPAGAAPGCSAASWSAAAGPWGEAVARVRRLLGCGAGARPG